MQTSGVPNASTTPAAGLPAVSVVMPVYNGERYVGEAIESVLAQTHRDLELVVVDDGSTDGTWAILEGYAARDPRVRAFTQANADQPATLNRGLGLARHEWVAIHDHDDVSRPERLERQLRFLAAHPGVRVLGTYATQIDEQGRTIGLIETGPISPEQFERIRAANDWLILLHPSVVLHRATVLGLGGYDPAFGPAADTELWSRVADRHPVLVVPERLVEYRMHGASMTSTRFFEQREMLRWIKVREHARRAGNPVPTLEEHLAAQHRGLRRLRALDVKRDDATRYCIHRAKLAHRRGRTAERVVYLAAAATLAPKAAIERLRYGYWLR